MVYHIEPKFSPLINGLNESYINQILEPTEGSYKKVIKTFHKNVTDAITERKGKNIQICAISRKTPKLLQLLHKDFDICWDNIEIITELAIPFLNWAEIEELILIDDAIYYGSTFNNVYNLITEHKAEVKITPITCIKASEAPLLKFDRDLRTMTKPRGFSHYFVNQLSNDFFQLGSPFEVEFPIFYIDLPDGYSLTTKFKNEMTSIFRNQFYEVPFRCDNFTQMEQIKGANRVKEFSLNLANDQPVICKFRFYIKDNRLIIVSLSPYDILQRELENNTLFNGSIYKSAWNTIRNGLYNLDKNNSMLENSRYKGLCMWANYLFSLNLFLEYRKQLLEIIKNAFELEKDPQPYLNNKDLTLLVGKEKSKDIFPKLEKIITESDKNNSLLPPNDKYLTEIFSTEYLLEDIQFPAYYYTSQKILLEQCQNLNEALSSIYFLQNVMLDKMNRPFYVLASKRLTYGNTFATLENLLKLYYKNKIDNKNTIHQWVDSFIDRATIVPQYIHVNNNEANGKWVRVFRSGENEVPIISHFARYFLMIYLKIQELTGLKILSKQLFQSLVTAVTLQKDLNIRKFLHYNLGVTHEPGLYKLILYNSDKQNHTEILDLLTRINIFSIEQNEYVTIHPDLLDTELTERTILPETIEEEIKKTIENFSKQLHNTDNLQLSVPFFNAFFIFNNEILEDTDKHTKEYNIFDLVQAAVERDMKTDDELSLIREKLMLLRKMQIIRNLDKHTHKTEWAKSLKTKSVEEIGQVIQEKQDNWDSDSAVDLINIAIYCLLKDTCNIILNKLTILKKPEVNYFRHITERNDRKESDKTIRKKVLSTILDKKEQLNELFT